MSLAWRKCGICGKRISLGEDGLLDGVCFLCSVKQI